MPEKPNNLEIAFGGRNIDVVLADGSIETVRVRILPLRMAEAYINRKLKRDDQGVIELCIGKSAEWNKEFADTHYADRFPLEEQVRLLGECDALNFTSATRWVERAMKSSGALSPLMAELYRKQAIPMKQSIVEALGSVISSLTPVLSSANLTMSSSAITPAPSSNSSASSMTGSPAATPSDN